MDELAKLMYTKVKGAGQVSLAQTSQRNDIQQLSDIILTPLMNLLNGRSVQVIPYAFQSNTLEKNTMLLNSNGEVVNDLCGFLKNNLNSKW